MIFNKVVAGLLAMCVVSAFSQTQQTAAKSGTTQIDVRPYVKPCLINVVPRIWLDLNTVQAVEASEDGTTLRLVFSSGEGYAITVPADQAMSYAKKLIYNFEMCKR